MKVHTREGHPFKQLHGPLKDPYLVVEYGERLGLSSREYKLVDIILIIKESKKQRRDFIVRDGDFLL